MTIRIIKHEAITGSGSFEVRFGDGRDSAFFYWDDIQGRRVRPDQMDSQTAQARAQAFARLERDKKR